MRYKYLLDVNSNNYKNRWIFAGVRDCLKNKRSCFFSVYSVYVVSNTTAINAPYVSENCMLGKNMQLSFASLNIVAFAY